MAREIDELRRLISRCCELAEASDKAAMAAIEKAKKLEHAVARNRRLATSALSSLRKRVEDLERLRR